MKITLRHITYVVVFILIAALSFQSYRLSSKIDKLDSANVTLALIKERLSHKQDSLDLLASQAAVLKFKADSLGVVVDELEKNNELLSGKLDSALTAIDSIPPEENYVFLQDSAYRYPGELKYPFNGKQVTEIRKTYVENVMVKKININLATTVNILRKQNETQDSLISNQYVQLDMYSGMIGSLKNIVATQEGENDKLNKDLIKQKKLKILFEGSTAVGIIFILISLL